MLDVPFSKEEISAAISSLQSGKSPGPDSFSVEFFKSFAPQLVPLLHSVLSESMLFGSSKLVQGIQRGQTGHKVSLYADDLLLFISNPHTSLPSILSLLTLVSQV